MTDILSDAGRLRVGSVVMLPPRTHAIYYGSSPGSSDLYGRSGRARNTGMLTRVGSLVKETNQL